MWYLLAFLPFVRAAMFGVFSDPACESLVIPVLAFSDVCTWNTYTSAYSLYLESCTSNTLQVQLFNVTDSPTCASFPTNQTFSVTQECQPTSDYYTRILNTTECLGENTTFNILAHDHSDCSDGGLPFSLVSAKGGCVGNSFAPSQPPAGWDTRAFVTDSLFVLEVYESTNGTCEGSLGDFRTRKYGSECLAPIDGFYNSTYMQLYKAFPLQRG